MHVKLAAMKNVRNKKRRPRFQVLVMLMNCAKLFDSIWQEFPAAMEISPV